MVNIAAGGVPFNFWRVMESGFLTNIIRQQRNLGAMAFIFTQIAVHIRIDGIGSWDRDYLWFWPKKISMGDVCVKGFARR